MTKVEHGGGPAATRPAFARSGRGDRLFRPLTAAAGLIILAVMAAIAVFLIAEALPALRANKANFFTETSWQPDQTPARFGIAALASGTIMTSALALILATPVAIGVALFISHYAPRRAAPILGYVIDLLAAVPSVVYGLWGMILLVPKMQSVEQFLNSHAGFIPIFGGTFVAGRSIFTASVVLAIMILPIMAAIIREVFLQTPRANEEAALALGATRWEMVRMTVLPFARPGIVSAAMLGLGRALGETIAVALVLSSNFVISLHIFSPGGNTFAANIANAFGEAGPTGRGSLIASGLVLFVITLIVNMAARLVIARRREYARAAA